MPEKLIEYLPEGNNNIPNRLVTKPLPGHQLPDSVKDNKGQ